MRWMYWISLLAGLWLVVSSWVLPNHATLATAVWSDVAAGTVLIVVAGYALFGAAGRERWMPWVLGLAGVYLVAAPWLMPFTTLQYATWDSVIIGLIAFVLAWLEGAALPQAAR